MRLNYEEAEEFINQGDYDYPYGMDDIARLVELKNILLKYTDKPDILLLGGEGQTISICEYPSCGIEEDDVIKIAELLFFMVDGCIVMYG